MHRLRATVLPREGSLLSECEESVVPSYLQATGKLSLRLSGRPFTLLLCVCVCVFPGYSVWKKNNLGFVLFFIKPSYFFRSALATSGVFY